MEDLPTFYPLIPWGEVHATKKKDAVDLMKGLVSKPDHKGQDSGFRFSGIGDFYDAYR